MKPFRAKEKGLPGSGGTWLWLTLAEDAILAEPAPLDPTKTADPMFHAAWMARANEHGPAHWLLYELILKVKVGWVRKSRVCVETGSRNELGVLLRRSPSILTFSDRSEAERFVRLVRERSTT